MLLMFVQGWLSDRWRKRAPVLFFNACLCATGLCLMCWTDVPGVQYFGTICVTAGASANIPAVMVYQANNIRRPWKRAFCSASLISFGGTGGIAGSLIFRAQDAPEYVPGIIACLVYVHVPAECALISKLMSLQCQRNDHPRDQHPDLLLPCAESPRGAWDNGVGEVA